MRLNPLFCGKQIVNALLTTMGHMSEDRVFFSMQLARRLPKSASTAVGRILGTVPGAAAGAAAAWLVGEETQARQIIAAAESSEPSRLLGEIALNLGMLDVATRIAAAIDSSAYLQSRILWTNGDIDRAIDVLPAGRRMERLKGERGTLSQGWWPKPANFVLARKASRNNPTVASSLHVLTNSLPHTHSGYAYRSHFILSTLNRSGHRAVAATRPSYPVTIGRLSSRQVETVDGVEYLRHIPLIPSGTPATRISEQAEWIARQARRRRVDVLHTTTHYVNGLATGAAARAAGLPWVYEVRGVLEETWAAAGATSAERSERRSSQRFQYMRAKEIEVAAAADAVITLGETMRSHLVAGGVPQESITLIPNAVSESVVNADCSRKPHEVRAGLGLPTAGIWVGTAASIVGYEGLDDLVDAVILARRQGVDMRLLIAGDGIALPALRERARLLGEHAVFTGRVSSLAAIEYQLGLDIIAVPRKNEPVCRLVTPIKPIEGMGLGRPVVISDLPALRELVPGKTGTYVESENPQKLSEVLSGLACDDEWRIEMGLEGREHVLATRRWKDIGHRYGDVYSRVVSAGEK